MAQQKYKQQKKRRVVDLLHSILASDPISCEVQNGCNFEIHVVTSHDHIFYCLWAIKSFVWTSHLTPSIFIHDDGSLSRTDVKILREHLVGVKVISVQEADSKVRGKLEQYPMSRRFCRDSFLAKKIFNVYFFAISEKILIIDSDVLFFSFPRAICSWASSREKIIRYDYDPFDFRGRDKELKIENGLGINYVRYYNSGLQCLYKKVFDLQLIEKFLDFCYRERIIEYVTEQRCMSILVSRHKHRPLSRHYFFQNKRNIFYTNRGLKSFASDFVAKHYSRYARTLFASEGINHFNDLNPGFVADRVHK